MNALHPYKIVVNFLISHLIRTSNPVSQRPNHAAETEPPSTLQARQKYIEFWTPLETEGGRRVIHLGANSNH